MYKVNTLIKGNVSLLQNKFSTTELEGLGKGLTKKGGSTDYSLEWMEKMYATHDGFLYQPGDHIEGALVKSATTFKIKGRGNKTWKDPIRAYCYVVPDEIHHAMRTACAFFTFTTSFSASMAALTTSLTF